MADERQKVRIEEHLKIKIGEAKNLQSRSHGSTLHRDVYCTVSLDQEEIFRTSTMEKTLCPFFGEEFQFEVPRRFRYLSIYVYDRDRHLKQDKVMGKVAIKREDLNKYHNKDHWFAIRPVDADSEVQGKIHVEITTNSTQSLIKIVECCDLTLKNGCCDSYAQVTCTYSSSRKVTKRTKVKKKTTCPKFDEGFTFEQGDDDTLCEVCVGLWHDMGMGEDLFLGEVRIDLRRSDTSNWYFLQPRKSTSKTCSTPPGTRLSCDNSLGSLRLQVYYTADYVFSKEVYAPLRNLLLESVNLQPITSSAVYILGEIVTSKMEAALPLVRVFMHNGQIVDIIQALANFEISKLTDPTTIFRGNTLVSKMMDEAMKLIGLNYLHTTLRPVINLIFVERKPCEIDPTRCYNNIDNNSTTTTTTETNLLNLIEYVQKVFDAIVDSAVHCPSLLCQIFHNLKECAIKYFPNNKEVRYSVISGFIFLRFFAPAILGPKLFQITNEQIDSQTNRTLTLISKTIQSLGNLVSARSVQQTCKESYMERVHKAFATDAHIQKLRQFLEIISASSNPNEISVNNTPVVLKEGVMIKRAQGRKRFGRKNFKERYFRLSTHDLIYSKSKNKEPLCCIPLTDILAVEQLNESSFKMKNMFQIIQKERTLYIQANNCVEQKGWLDLLTKLCQSNNNRLQRYHPAAYLNGRWLCCNGCCVDTPGCEAVINGGNDSLTSNQLIDNCCDLERIYSLIIEHYDRLLVYRQRCEQQAVYTGDVCIRPNCIIDDIQSTFKTIQQLQEIIYQLQHKHFMYQKLKQTNIKYGSKQAPIGDDNYLNLAARLSLDPTFARKCIDAS